MSISPTITRRTLLMLTSAFALLPLAGCTEATADGPKPEIDSLPLQEGKLLVASDHSPVAGNAAWCAPMQLCWDNLKDTLNEGQPLSEADKPEIVAELNNATFEADMVGDDHYVTYSGPQTVAARAEIEQLIKDRFDQESDVLNMLDWAENPEDANILFYAMLFRIFTFGYVFDVLDNAPFGSADGGNLKEDVAYFGADGSSEPDVLGQVDPIFWEADDRCAVQIDCKENDRVILARGLKGNTFDEMWDDLMDTYASSTMPSVASFACPKLKVDVLTKYTELEGLKWDLVTGESIEIDQALQTLRFKLDETGGSIKSEAVISVKATGFFMEDPVPRDFRFDDTFVLFLVDLNAEGDYYPYAGLLVNDMEEFAQ